MHDGCSSYFENGKQIVDKIRQMGFNSMPVPIPIDITCTHCSGTFTMETLESSCPQCNMVYGVTPCHATSADNVQAAGIGY